MNIQLIVIDPQVDFCDPNGALYVSGAEGDMARLADLVSRLGGEAAGDKCKIDDIHVTMDSHRLVDISHPLWWKGSTGASPAPFTIITAQDMKDGKWTTFLPSHYDRTLAYLEALESTGRYPHCIWPPHCLIGSPGHVIFPALFAALQEWEARFSMVNYVTKGSNPFTEHFSAVRAEVPDPSDPSTQVNTRLIQTLEQADIILLSGEALSHCLANTGRDIVASFSDPKYIGKITLLTDATSSVAGFEQLGKDFVTDMVAKGMKTATCAEFLAQVV